MDISEEEKAKIREDYELKDSVRIKKDRNGDIMVAPKQGFGHYSECWIKLS